MALSRRARRAAARSSEEPDIVLQAEGDVIAETSEAVVVRLEQRLAGRKTSALTVFLRPDVSAGRAAVELRALADEIDDGLRA